MDLKNQSIDVRIDNLMGGGWCNYFKSKKCIF